MSTAPRSADLFNALRGFCLGSFFDLGAEVERGADIPVALAEHGGADRPTLYEYRPLVGAFVEERACRLGLRDDARDALTALKDEPAAGIFARAHADEGVGEDEALKRTVLLPLLVRTAEGCTGFDWDDAVFERAYAELERSLFGDRRAYAALAPLVGLTAGGTIELGRGLRVRPAAKGELTAAWPEANRLLPADFGREVDRTLVPGARRRHRVRSRGQRTSPGDSRRGRSGARPLRAPRLAALRRSADTSVGRSGPARGTDPSGSLPCEACCGHPGPLGGAPSRT
jgi:hypothetical protein